MSDKNYSDFFGAYAKIYTISDVNGNVFYVGCTTNSIEARLAGHISEARNTNTYNKLYSSKSPKSVRIRELDFKIVITIVHMQWVTSFASMSALKKMARTEKEWIKKYMDLGYSLCNREAIVKVKKEKILLSEFIGQSLTTDGNGKIINQNLIENSSDLLTEKVEVTA